MHKETGRPLPAPLLNKPKLPSSLLLAWNAFMALAHDRQVYMGGVTQIPYTALSQWARDHGVEGETFDRIVRLVKAMDGVWIEDVDRRMKAARR
ncbi:hypothetical protein [Methylopila sp. 73B]|uniref:phage tail assembly chaperone n=1 Tax=Methylopila sp. 73B TaxID=1120792 RepID=UPI000377A149|nr:hypothetical protein [Methylopila sp. 73B]